jgi:endo-1,4-beta-xylanase
VVRFAEVHGMKIRGHCLVWGHDNPDWLAQGRFAPRRLSQLLREHITRVLKRYKDQVFAWDVINEALDENGQVRNSIWCNRPGIGLSGKGSAYIGQVFRWAHKADPHALLFYNEAEGEALNHESDAIYMRVKKLQAPGRAHRWRGTADAHTCARCRHTAITAALSAYMQRPHGIGVANSHPRA